MTTESAILDADARQWAIEALGFGDAGDTADNAMMLRFVDESDYVLMLDQTDAVQIVAGSARRNFCPSIVERAAIRSRYRNQRDAVAEYNRQFFNLPCKERQPRWESLLSECSQSPDMVAKLMRLKPGLNVVLPPLVANSHCDDVLRICRDVFLEPPGRAARLRLQFCDQWRKDVSIWEEVVDEALDKYGEFLQAISPWLNEFGDRRFWEERTRLADEQILSQGSERLWSEFTPQKHAVAQVSEQEHLVPRPLFMQEGADSDDGTEQLPSWIWIVVATAIVLFLIALSQPSLTIHDQRPVPKYGGSPFLIPPVHPQRLK